jgi:NitT/TauT family transport system substrate-binding protein
MSTPVNGRHADWRSAMPQESRKAVTRRVLVATALAAPAIVSLARRSDAAEPVSLGLVNTISDAGFFVADAKGYFKAEGIEVTFQRFPSASGMISSLASGDLDVGSGAVSAGHYNANDRQIPLKFVADKSRNEADMSFQSIIVRKALIDEGKFKSFADLKGCKFAIPAPASVGEQSILNEALKRASLGWNDCERAFLGINEQVVAFKNGALDASITSEPLISIMEKQGFTHRFATVGSFYPNQQAAVVCYGAPFLGKRPEVGRRFIKAYIKGVRDYNDVLKDGRMAGPGADEVVDTIAHYSVTKDKDLIKSVIPAALHPDGEINVEALGKDLEFARAIGLVKGNVAAADVVDMSFAKAAVAELGPYKKRTG